jgi:predicted dehydrogenase
MLRIGMIGAGTIAEMHAGNLTRIDGVTITGAVDISKDRAGEFVARFGGRQFDGFEDLLAECDAVYICTPPQHHREPSVLAAKAGVHVFCEKPLATTVDDALAIEKAVVDSGITYMVGFNMRYSPAFPHIKNMIDDGVLGDIYSFWGTRVLWLPHLPPNWRTNPKFICGMTIESLSHDFDVLRWMAGDVVAATGLVATSRPDLDGYDNILSTFLNLESGGMASFHSSWASHVHFSQYGIIGTKGSIAFDWEKVRIKTEADSNERTLEFKNPSDNVESHRRETEHFIDCLKNGKTPNIGVSDGVGTVLISAAVLQSSALKRTVAISEITA